MDDDQHELQHGNAGERGYGCGRLQLSTVIWFRVYQSNPADPMGELVFSSSVTGRQASVLVGGPAGLAFVDQPLPAAASDFGGIRHQGILTLRVQVSVTGDLTGQISVDRLYRADILGQVQSWIRQWDAPNLGAAIQTLRLGSVAQGMTIDAVRGPIRVVEVFDGDLLGSVVAHNSWIGTIDVGSGDIGSSGSPVLIRAKSQDASNSNAHIGSIIAGDVYADIDTGVGGTPHVNMGTLDLSGEFNGSIDVAGWVLTNPSIGGDLNGTINMNQALPSTRTILIGGSLAAGGSINLPANGLVGQVSINIGDMAGSWAGSTSVGGSSLSGPYYTNTAASLGGGSVGLATFNMHGSSCAPADGALVYVDSSLLINGLCLDQCERDEVEASVNEVIVRHYGPVEWSSGTPLTVKRRSLACGGSQNWSTVTSDFSFAIQSGSGERGVKVTYTGGSSAFWPIDYEYLIEPVAGVLRSKGVAGAPDVADYDYNFSLVADCAESFMSQYDRNHDDALCSADIVAWSVEPTDLNNDSVIDQADLAVLWEVVQTHGN